MKRFYCTICQRVKRVRKYPPTVRKDTIGLNPMQRTGVCKWHKLDKSDRKVG